MKSDLINIKCDEIQTLIDKHLDTLLALRSLGVFSITLASNRVICRNVRLKAIHLKPLDAENVIQLKDLLK